MKPKKYTIKGYGGYSVDPIDPLKSKTRLDTFSNNKAFSPDAIKWPPTQSVDTTPTEITPTMDVGAIVNGAGQALGAIGSIGNGVAKTVSTGLDIANGVLGSIDNQRLKREEQHKIAETLQKRPYDNMYQQGINNIPVYTKFGGVAKMEGGDKNPNVEAEDGEVLEHQDGSYFEADGDRHEQGGEMYSNISRVLEDTAGKRKDPMSKYLLIDKDTAKTIIGKPVKRGMSHAEVFTKATEQMNKLQSKYVANIDAVESQKTPDTFAINSARLNTKFGNELPTSAQLFDTLFEHQEKVKSDYGKYRMEQEVPKAAYGADLTIDPPNKKAFDAMYPKALIDKMTATQKALLAKYPNDTKISKKLDNFVFDMNYDPKYDTERDFPVVDEDYKKIQDKLINADTNQMVETFHGVNSIMESKNPLKILGLKTPDNMSKYEILKAYQKIKADKKNYTFAYGGDAAIGPIIPYGGNKNKKKTPTGQVNKFTPEAGFQDYVNDWNGIVPGASESADARDFQSAIYDHLMKTPAGQKEIARMWKANGNTEYGIQSGTGKDFDFNNLSVANLAVLKGAYVDDKLGVRKLDPNYNPDTLTVNNSNPRVGYDGKVSPTIDRSVVMPDPQAVPEPFSITQQPESKLNNPLRWNDTIGPVMGLINSMTRDPELYNSVKLNPIKYGLQDVRPILNNNQAEYNAARQGLGNTSIGNAQAAQLFSNKLKADNQAIGQYENQNTQITNQEIAQNNEIQSKQEMADASSRESYYTKVLTARAKQQEAKQSAVEQLADNVGKHNAFNKNAELLMKLAPAFDQNANYNGRKYNFANNSGNSTGVVSNPPGTTLYKVTRKDGKVSEEFLNDREYQLRLKSREYQNLQKITRK